MEPNYEQLLREEREMEAGTSCKVRHILYFRIIFIFKIKKSFPASHHTWIEGGSNPKRYKPNSLQVKILFNFKMGSGLGSLVGSTSKLGLRGLGFGTSVRDWGEGLGLGTSVRIRFRNQG